VYDYTQEFNNLAQYRGHHVDSDAKKAELYHKGLNIQLQDHLVQNLNLFYNDLACTAIDQEGTMRVCEAAVEKKRTMPGPTGGSSSGAPPKYHMVYTHPRGSHAGLRSSGKPSTVSPAAVVQLHTFHYAATGSSSDATVGHTRGVPVLQLWEGWALL
jgi:hypothetical protein